MIKRWKKLNLTVQIMIGLAIRCQILGFIIPKKLDRSYQGIADYQERSI